MNIVYANEQGDLFDSDRLIAAGRSGADVTEIEKDEWIPLPKGASMVMLPGTRALGLDQHGHVKAMPTDFHAVGALLPQSYTRLFLPAFANASEQPLPLFGYTAVGFEDGRFYVAAHQTDEPSVWDPSQYDDQSLVDKNVKAMQNSHPQNRLYEHLSTCALYYECVTSRNTFFGRQEGALPVSGTCNAGCIGCISEQPEDSGFPSPQTRLTIRPTVEEMVDLMVTHLQSAGPNGIISFGQGCEGEPMLRGREIAQAITKTREHIETGYINANTNAGMTQNVLRVVDAGLNLMRVSTISARHDHYDAYYRPRGYTIDDVRRSAKYASEHGVIVSLNYLVFPGVSDREEEIEAMIDFINDTGVRLVQMRNLNIDPDYYLSLIPSKSSERYGMLGLMEILQKECPELRIGSYTHTPDWYR